MDYIPVLPPHFLQKFEHAFMSESVVFYEKKLAYWSGFLGPVQPLTN